MSKAFLEEAQTLLFQAESLFFETCSALQINLLNAIYSATENGDNELADKLQKFSRRIEQRTSALSAIHAGESGVVYVLDTSCEQH